MANRRPAQVAGKESIHLAGQDIEYWLARSPTAKKLRIKVALDEIHVILPASRQAEEAREFLRQNAAWVIAQVERMNRYRAVRRPEQTAGEMLFRGEPTKVLVIRAETWRGPNRVQLGAGGIAVLCGPSSRTRPAASLENWLRKQAKQAILRLVDETSPKVNRVPQAVYVMGQRTKWGNCSALGNLSFNWRLILAPDFVLRYLVTHEVVHLAIPDHSQRFWLAVQSLCPDSERARRWLSANADRLMVELGGVVAKGGA